VPELQHDIPTRVRQGSTSRNDMSDQRYREYELEEFMTRFLVAS
jgi:hypothetical protein